MSHHARSVVLENVTVIHPFSGTVIRHPRNTNLPESRDVRCVFPRKECRRLTVNLENLKEKAVQMERMMNRRSVQYVPDLQLSNANRVGVMMLLAIDVE